jgi:GNAT superfamily N-acetyltransferase
MNIEVFDREWLDENDYAATDEIFKLFNLVNEQEWAKTDTVGIAYDDDNIVGVILTDGYEVCNIVQVLESHQRQGIGRQLVESTKAYYPRQNGSPDFWESFDTEQLILRGQAA